MTDGERQQRIKALFQAALDRPSDSRFDFVRSHPDLEPVVRDEVVSLLSAHAQAGPFMERPALEALGSEVLADGDARPEPRFRPGDHIGSYAVVSFMAAGGMGEVYRAIDPKLQRQVAIKVLTPEAVGNADRLARFVREARLLAALNHPHIAQIYGVEDGGPHQGGAIVLELIEGPTLAERLAQGPLQASEALDTIRQVADALAAAHEKGIVHRDLKPSNIKCTPHGAKVLDFGLAKAAPREHPSASLETRPQTVIGTVAYMSPEQIRGQLTDQRTDIWALGCVLFETLTGSPAFSGATAADTMAAIVEREPVWSLLPASTGSGVRRVLRRCLQKDPDQRWRNAADIRLALEDLAAGQELEDRASGAERRRLVTIAAAVLVFTAMTAAVLMSRRTPGGADGPSTAKPILTTIELPQEAPLALGATTPLVGWENRALALSPDGRRLVYIGSSPNGPMLYLRDLGSHVVAPIAGTEGATFAFFSPDGRWVGFLTNDRVKKVALEGGQSATLCEASSPALAAWARDGYIYFGDDQNARISRVSAEGGQSSVMQQLPGLSAILPDGRHALVAPRTHGISRDYADISLVSLASGESRVLIRSGFDARYVDPGWIVFGRAGALLAVRFDLSSALVVGEPATIVSSAAMESLWGQMHADLSGNGVLAYVPGSDRAIGRLTWIDRSGGIETLPAPAAVYGVVSLSPDGTKVAAHVADVTDSVVIFDVRRQEGRRLSPPAEHAGFPVWHPDNDRVAFATWQVPAQFRTMARSIGGGPGLRFAQPYVDNGRPSSYSPDGRVLALYSRGQILRFATPDSLLQQIEIPGVRLYDPDFSPDGRFVAYGSNETGRSEIFVRSYPDGRIVRQISSTGGVEARWCRCGELIYRNGSQWLSVRIRTDGDVHWEPPRTAFPPQSDFVDTPGRSYDITPDGQRLLIVRRESGGTKSRIQLAVNWPALLQRAGSR